LRLRFRSDDDGVVRAVFRADPQFQGYDGIVHGGIIAALLDAAMTHCLFRHRIQGITGDLHVRFVHSIPCDAEMKVRARLLSGRRSLYRLKAEIEVNHTIAAWAEAIFMRRRIPGAAEPDPEGGTI
jgi:acyl-coenzyme A thioesterase PaaI-like protein